MNKHMEKAKLVLGFRYIVKTPNGYVTANGTTQDISDKSIIVVGICGINSTATGLKEKLVESCMQWSTEKGKWKADECRILRYICEEEKVSKCDECFRACFCNFCQERTEAMFNDITPNL